jgi:hypothetical protein
MHFYWTQAVCDCWGSWFFRSHEKYLSDNHYICSFMSRLGIEANYGFYFGFLR